ncbi:STAS domain-containing protein [Kineococcus xinjiangensis]|uniref:STAS domain-containing protein n=1 Tax=Kineococcus xinjiangensis TaxID=512762 RepID=UPI001304C65F|nr:STAS domain-containing protein [Kineococcus xinjiangensis]
MSGVEGIHVLERHDDAVVIALDDSTLLQGLGTLRWHLDEVLHRGPATLVIDLTQVHRLSSVTVAVLLRAKRQCRARGARVVLRGVSRSSLEVLQRTGLSPLFETMPATDGFRPAEQPRSAAS